MKDGRFVIIWLVTFLTDHVATVVLVWPGAPGWFMLKVGDCTTAALPLLATDQPQAHLNCAPSTSTSTITSVVHDLSRPRENLTQTFIT